MNSSMLGATCYTDTYVHARDTRVHASVGSFAARAHVSARWHRTARRAAAGVARALACRSNSEARMVLLPADLAADQGCACMGRDQCSTSGASCNSERVPDGSWGQGQAHFDETSAKGVGQCCASWVYGIVV